LYVQYEKYHNTVHITKTHNIVYQLQIYLPSLYHNNPSKRMPCWGDYANIVYNGNSASYTCIAVRLIIPVSIALLQ